MAWAPEDLPVPYYINPDQLPLVYSNDFALVQTAFDEWQRRTYGTLVFEFADWTTAYGHHEGLEEVDRQNTLSFGDQRDQVDEPDVALTKLYPDTTRTFVVDGTVYYAILDADIVFNNEGFFAWGTDEELWDPYCGIIGPPKVEIHRVALHEIGHFLGLDHSVTEGDLMYDDSRFCDEHAGQFTTNDVFCLKQIYPPPTPLMVSDGLVLDASTPCFVGQRVQSTAIVVNTTTGPLILDALTITGRHADGSVWDFLHDLGVVIDPDAFREYTGSLTFGLPGDYTFEVSHRIGSSWYQTPGLEGIPTTAAVYVSSSQPFFAGIHKQTGDHHIFIYPSRGDGTFQQEERIAEFDGGAAEIRAIAIADFNGDLLYDVFAALNDRRCFYLRNEGAIVFTPIEIATLEHGVPYASVTAGDFTGDGDKDALVVAGNGGSQTFYLFEHLDGAPTVTATPMPGPAHDAGNLDNKAVDAEYVDGDRALDIVVSYYDDDDTQPIVLHRGLGDGTFQAGETITNDPPGTSGSVALTLGDFDGDRLVDLIVGMDDDGDAGQAWGTPGNGNGTFTLDWTEVVDVNNTGHCDAFDFNQDGRLDIVGIAWTQPGRLFLGQGMFTFADPVIVYPASGGRLVASTSERSPVGSTPVGQQVVTFLAGFAIAAFDSISASGVTSLALADPTTGPPSLLSIAVMDITTTATVVDSISLALPYAQHLAAYPDVAEATLRLYHDHETGWVEIPSFLDLTGQILHARVSTLSAFAIVGDDVTGVLPGGLETFTAMLAQNAPNPFNPNTELRFTLAEKADVLLGIYDIRGRLVRTLLAGSRIAGAHTVVWDGRDDTGVPASSGVYFCRLRAGDRHETRKVTLVR